MSPGNSVIDIGHWITVYVDYNTLTLGYYDSYNLDPSFHSKLLHEFIQASPYLRLNQLSYRLQGLQSLVCGVYAMLFCYLHSHYPVKRVMRYIHDTFKKRKFLYNDKLILCLGYRLFKMPQCEKIFCLRGDEKQCRLHICSPSNVMKTKWRRDRLPDAFGS